MELVVNALEQGLLFALVAMGVYITYKILDFPDLSVDGTFPLGAAISAALLVNGVNAWVSINCSNNWRCNGRSYNRFFTC